MLNIFVVVFTVKKSNFFYSDFMFFCDFRSIVLIQYVKKKIKNNYSHTCEVVLKIMTPSK